MKTTAFLDRLLANGFKTGRYDNAESRQIEWTKTDGTVISVTAEFEGADKPSWAIRAFTKNGILIWSATFTSETPTAVIEATIAAA